MTEKEKDKIIQTKKKNVRRISLKIYNKKTISF